MPTRARIERREARCERLDRISPIATMRSGRLEHEDRPAEPAIQTAGGMIRCVGEELAARREQPRIG